MNQVVNDYEWERVRIETVLQSLKLKFTLTQNFNNIKFMLNVTYLAIAIVVFSEQNMNFSIKDFFSKCDQISIL